MAARTPTISTSARSSLWRAAGLTLVLAVVINELIRLAALALIHPDPNFLPLTAFGPVLMFTAIGAIGASLVYWLMTRLSKRPQQLFTTVAWVVLLLSFIPNILTGLNPQSAPFSGVTWATIGTLMLMHLPPALLSIYLLPRK
jgi:MFS superfamily sulfate permease-like transporter